MEWPRHRVTEFLLGLFLAALACDLPHGYGASPATRPANPEQEKAIRKRCIESLQAIRQGFEGLARKNPEVWSHLGPGEIDEANLSLHFPLVDNSRKPLKYVGRGASPYRLPRRSGIFVWFESSPRRDGLELTYSLRWPVIGLTFSWSWSWVGGSSHDDLSGFQQVIRQAVRPLAELEASALGKDVSAHNEDAYVLRGETGVELTIREESRPRDTGTNIVALYLKNTTGKTLAVCPPDACVVIQDHIVLIDRLLPPASALRLLPSYGLGLGEGPFIHLAPGENRKVRTAALGRLAIGEHTIRIVQEYTQTDWLDMRPIAYDGAPVRRKVENAWTGILVSQQLTITVSTPASGPHTTVPAR